MVCRMSRSTRAALCRGAMCHGGILREIPVGTHLNPAPYISKFTSQKERSIEAEMRH